ncbi:MAG: UDP-N-acetylglucosamine 1-carboxyvinyltransferase [Ruminococcaceae bacterium]|nr:UDP-N-acetylglucosamine 1-carboxyvinyltransferase [Oscillospiraceae bacterium]
MSKIIIEGGKKLNGTAQIDGAKNSILPILAATLLISGTSEIHNCPNLSDVDVALKILSHLGCVSKREGQCVIVNCQNVNRAEVPHSLMREMRSSIVFLGAILARTGKAIMSSPGGCELGPRPVDLHIKNLKILGAQIEEDGGFLNCSLPDGFKGEEIYLSFASVGATENIMIAATLAHGKTIIHNAAREPEIVDLADFLNSAGAKIFGAGSNTIEIIGVDKLYNTSHKIIPDRIIASTYMAAVGICGGSIILKDVIPAQLAGVIDVMKQAGAEIFAREDTLKINMKKRPKRISSLHTQIYPGFPTDSGPPILAMLTKARGTSVFVENIFQNRYNYVDELKRLGANIKTEGRVAVVEGCLRLSGAPVRATDLRGGAALVVAGLGAEGTTAVDKICYIKRGYADIARDLKMLGAEIKEE